MSKQKDDGYVRFRCKACGQKLKIRKDREGGHVVPCPKCGEMVNVPLANIDALAQDPGLRDDTERKNIGGLNKAKLLSYLADDEVGREEERQAAAAAWTGGQRLERIKALDELKGSLKRIHNDSIEKAQSLFRQQRLDDDTTVKEMQTIGAQQRQELMQNLIQTRDELKRKLELLESVSGGLEKSGKDRIVGLNRSIRGLTLYAKHVLGVEL